MILVVLCVYIYIYIYICWGLGISPLKHIIMLESSPPKPTMLVGRLGVSKAALRYYKVCVYIYIYIYIYICVCCTGTPDSAPTNQHMASPRTKNPQTENLSSSGKSHMDLGIPPLNYKNVTESEP